MYRLESRRTARVYYAMQIVHLWRQLREKRENTLKLRISRVELGDTTI